MSTEAEHCDPVQPEDQATCDRDPGHGAPSRTELDDREANRASQRKASGPGGRRGHERASHALPDADTSGEAAAVETAPETRLES